MPPNLYSRDMKQGVYPEHPIFEKLIVFGKFRLVQSVRLERMKQNFVFEPNLTLSGLWGGGNIAPIP